MERKQIEFVQKFKLNKLTLCFIENIDVGIFTKSFFAISVFFQISFRKTGATYINMTCEFILKVNCHVFIIVLTSS